LPSSLRVILVLHRSLALLLVTALTATQGALSLLHTHLYDDHDHPEHRHGLAAHEPHSITAHAEENSPHVEGCDPAQHVLSFRFICAAPPQTGVVDVDVSLPGSLTPQTEITLATQPTDVRVHGPPPRTQACPRAPPPTPHA
jgi:hypothetical protein